MPAIHPGRMHRRRRLRAGMPGGCHRSRYRARLERLPRGQKAQFRDLAEYHDQEGRPRRRRDAFVAEPLIRQISPPTWAKGTRRFKRSSVNPMVRMSHVAVKKRLCRDTGRLPYFMIDYVIVMSKWRGPSAKAAPREASLFGRTLSRLEGGGAIRVLIDGSPCARSPVEPDGARSKAAKAFASRRHPASALQKHFQRVRSEYA